MGLRNVRIAKQNVIGGLLVFTILIAVSLALGFYGYYTEKAPRTTISATSPTTTPTTTTTPANITNTTTVITTPTNTTSEVPYVPE